MPVAGRFRSVDDMTNNTFTPETDSAAAATGASAPTAAAPTAATSPIDASVPGATGATSAPGATTAYPASTPFQTPPAYPAASQPVYPPAAPAAAPQYYPAQPKTNVLGIVTLVLGILGFGLIPVITGHIALGQIKRTNEDGRGITLAGLILGYVTLAGWLAVAFFWVAIAAVAVIGSAAGVN